MKKSLDPLSFEIVSESIWLDPPNAELKSAEHAAASVEADVQIRLGDMVLVDRPSFSIFEFLHAFEKWRALVSRGDFVFNSFNDEHGDFIRILAGGDAFTFAVKWPEEWTEVQVTQDELFTVMNQLRQNVLTKAKADLGIDLQTFLAD
ncbi:MAG: hypothetical protein HRT81_17770 [Henriciella sp.]|nr:hypothetical protein [Henriciella sp.]